MNVFFLILNTELKNNTTESLDFVLAQVSWNSCITRAKHIKLQTYDELIFTHFKIQRVRFHVPTHRKLYEIRHKNFDFHARSIRRKGSTFSRSNNFS